MNRQNSNQGNCVDQRALPDPSNIQTSCDSFYSLAKKEKKEKKTNADKINITREV